MDTKIQNSIKSLGNKLFTNERLIYLINQIDNYNLNTLAYFVCIVQDKDKVQLECSLLTDKAIFDFSINEDDLAISYIILKSITGIQSTITTNYAMKAQINSTTLYLYYRTFNEHDSNILQGYVMSIINSLNN